MNFKRFFLAILLVFSFGARGQDNMPRAALDIGDVAPALYISEWIKGDPVQKFQKGRVYVLEFWATWCKPCIAAMPHLSQLATKYRDDVAFIGVDVYENEGTSSADIRHFVEERNDRISYSIAVDDNRKMVERWLAASDEVRNGIPRSFVINREGQIAWVGYPHELDTVLRQVITGDWDVAVFSEVRNQARYLDSISSDASYVIRDSKYDSHIQKQVPIYGTPELQLRVIDSLIRKEPKLAQTDIIVSSKLRALLDLDQDKAYHYAKNVLEQVGNSRQTGQLIDVITEFSEKSKLVPEIYLLAAQAYESWVAQVAYPELEDVSGYYSEMAYFYWLGQDQQKAVSAQEKAIELRQSQSLPAVEDFELMQERLMKYTGGT